jgi:hypothetical protein
LCIEAGTEPFLSQREQKPAARRRRDHSSYLPHIVRCMAQAESELQISFYLCRYYHIADIIPAESFLMA